MGEYKSVYTNSYIGKPGKGFKYDNKIENKFELFIWDLEKYFLTQAINDLKYSEQGSVTYLDFACGTGRLIAFFKNDLGFLNATGLDTSVEMIKKAKTKVAAEFLCGNINIEKNLLQGRKFDLVTVFRLFLNLEEENREKVLKELASYIKNGSYLILNNHMNRFSFLGLQFWIRKMLGNNHVITTATQSEFVKMIKNSGFEVEKIYKFTFFPGRNNFIFLPWNQLKKVEIMISKLPFLKNFCQSQIYVCKKHI